MPSTSVTIRLDENLKKQAEQLFNDMGLNMTTAFTIFAKAVVRQNRIPFEIAADPLCTEPTQHHPAKPIDLRTEFAKSMSQAAKDTSFIQRTLKCQNDFVNADSEVIGKW